jgi:hypothetical protein
MKGGNRLPGVKLTFLIVSDNEIKYLVPFLVFPHLFILKTVRFLNTLMKREKK